MNVFNYRDFGFKDFFAMFDKKVVSNGNVIKEKFHQLGRSDLAKIISDFNSICHKVQPSKDRFGESIASESISGGAYPCDRLACRLEKINILKYMALSMSKTVYFFNPFSSFQKDAFLSCSNEDYKWIITVLFDDFVIMNSLKDFILLGLALPFDTYGDICFECQLREIDGYGENLEIVSNKIDEMLLQQTTMTVEYFDEVIISINGPEDVYEHGGFGIIAKEIPHWIQEDPVLLSAVRGGGEINLTRDQILKSGILQDERHRLVSQAVSQLYYKNNKSIDLVIDRKIEHDVLRSFYGEEEARRDIVYSNLAFDLLPMLPQASFHDLVDLRLRESESFDIHIANLQT